MRLGVGHIHVEDEHGRHLHIDVPYGMPLDAAISKILYARQAAKNARILPISTRMIYKPSHAGRYNYPT